MLSMLFNDDRIKPYVRYRYTWQNNKDRVKPFVRYGHTQGRTIKTRWNPLVRCRHTQTEVTDTHRHRDTFSRNRQAGPDSESYHTLNGRHKKHEVENLLFVQRLQEAFIS